MTHEEIAIKLRSNLVSAIDAIFAYATDRESAEDVDRLDALELLNFAKIDEIEPAIRLLMQDEEELVRATALEIAADVALDGAEEIFTEGLTDPSRVVRMCSATAIAENWCIGCLEALLRALDEEKDAQVRHRIYYALWRFGNSQYAFNFLEGLFHSYYRIRCATISFLRDFVTDGNRSFFVSLVQTVVKNEQNIEARSSMEEFLFDFGNPDGSLGTEYEQEDKPESQ